MKNMDSGLPMKVLAVIPAKAGIQAFFLGFRPKACRNDDGAFGRLSLFVVALVPWRFAGMTESAFKCILEQAPSGL